MAYQVTMPQMGYDMTEGSINRWLVEEGSQVERGDVIASIATEKADIDIEAYASGVLRRILVPPGTKVAVGKTIALIAEADEELDDVESSPGPTAEASAIVEPSAATGGPPEEEPSRSRSGPAPEAGPSATTPLPDWAHGLTPTSTEPSPPRAQRTRDRIRVSPLAKRRAAELGVELGSVRGTGPMGRITAEDIEQAFQGGAAVPSGGRPWTADQADPSEAVPMSRMREAIARRMAESNSTIPHFYLSTEVDPEPLMRLRGELNQLADSGSPRFSVTDFVVRAMAMTLQRHPALNSAWIGGGVRRFSSSNIALAVAVPDGLVAPCLRSCESLGFAEMARRAHDLAARAKTNRLRPEELSGGHTAVSNLGMFGVSQFSAIITPGQGSVLAVGEVRELAVVHGGELAAGQRMALTLAIDHRVTDGAQGAEALAYLRWCLERPTACLL